MKLKVIPPLQKELFTDATTFENAMTVACSDILKVFSPHVRPLITISRTNMKVGQKMMKILLVVPPVEMEEDVARVELQGLKILKRTVFPTSEDFWEIRNSQYPKTTDIRITNLPALCDEQQLDELLQIPEDLERGQLLRKKLETELWKFYTGKAKISIKIETKEQEEDLKKWSHSKSFSDVAHWCELPIYASIPSIHECAKCKEEGRPRWRGHHENWCKINREKKLHVNEQKIQNIPTPPTLVKKQNVIPEDKQPNKELSHDTAEKDSGDETDSSIEKCSAKEPEETQSLDQEEKGKGE